MRDIVIFGIVFSVLPFAFKRPVIGVFAFTWISLMNPHRLTYGPAYSFQFAAIIAAVTLAAMLFSRQPKRFPLTPLTAMLLAFTAWMTLTTIFAMQPTLAWAEWERVMKTLLMATVAILLLNSERDIKQYAWVIALSLGFYGFKGGLFTLASGGSSHVFGPPYTYIGDNNALALALVATLPLIWYLRLHAEKKWLRPGLTGLAFLTVIAIVGSYSRGALLASSAMFFFLWLKSRHKLRTALIVLLIVPLIYAVMPDKWFGRMETIDNYKEDQSAMGRINSWQFAMNVAQDSLLGGGYRVFTPDMFQIYAPNPQVFFDAHSIYFQVLGEHGAIGLGLFLILMICAWRSGSRITKFCKNKAELRWAFDLASMCQVSIIGYAVGGAFLTLAYYDLYYFIIALLVGLEKAVLKKPQVNDSTSTHASTQVMQGHHGRTT